MYICIKLNEMKKLLLVLGVVALFVSCDKDAKYGDKYNCYEYDVDSSGQVYIKGAPFVYRFHNEDEVTRFEVNSKMQCHKQ